MSLPKLTTPEFETVLPSTGEKIIYRPFLVKEEKVLLIALESGESKDIVRAVENIINACVVHPETLEANKLPFFDLEYLFLNIRAKSVSEIITVHVKHSEENAACDHVEKFEINIENITVGDKKQDNVIMITDTVGIEMAYPTIATAQQFAELKTSSDVIDALSACIVSVFDGDEVHNDYSATELQEWIGTFSAAQMQNLNSFFEDMPSISYDIEWACEKCGVQEKTELRGLLSFFM